MRVVMVVLALLYLAKAPRTVSERPRRRRGVWNWTPLPLRYQLEITTTTLLSMMAIFSIWTVSRTFFPSDSTITSVWMFLGAMFVLYNAVAYKTLLTFHAIRAKARLRAM